MKGRRFQRMLAHPPGDWCRFAEAYLYLGIARAAILLVCFRRISRFLGVPKEESPGSLIPALHDQVRQITWALGAAARRTPWQSTCLVRALAGHAMLHRRGISGTLYLGVTPDSSDPRALNAHAWLRSGPLMVTGGKEQAGFTAVACFADHARKSEEAV